MSFGVTVDTVTSNVHGIAISATSDPSTTEIESWITIQSGIVGGIFEAKGLDPDDLSVGSAGYAYGHDAVVKLVLAQLLMAVQGRFDHAQLAQTTAETALRKLEQWAGVIGSSARTSEGSVDQVLSSSSEAMQAEINRRIEDRPSGTTLRQQMARMGRM